MVFLQVRYHRCLSLQGKPVARICRTKATTKGHDKGSQMVGGSKSKWGLAATAAAFVWSWVAAFVEPGTKRLVLLGFLDA